MVQRINKESSALHPIVFRAEDVRAIINLEKSQTRQLVKPQPMHRYTAGYGIGREGFPDEWTPAHAEPTEDDWRQWASSAVCPYGKPGDRLWVKEPFWLDRRNAGLAEQEVIYDATPEIARDHRGQIVPCRDLRGRPITRQEARRNIDHHPFWQRQQAIHMPKWASRLTLEITDVRTERLQQISVRDAIAEGIPQTWGDWLGEPPAWAADSIGAPYGAPGSHLWDNRTSLENYRLYWTSRHGRHSWDEDPWVWVIRFKLLRAEMDGNARFAAG